LLKQKLQGNIKAIRTVHDGLADLGRLGKMRYSFTGPSLSNVLA